MITVNAYLDGMRRYADFKGRATRAQFWSFYAWVLLVSLVGVFIDAATSNSEPPGVVTSLITLVHLLPLWAVSARRLHDIDRSGWWFLISAVPLVGAIVLIVFYCTASQQEANRFGQPVTPSAPGTRFDLDSYRQPHFSSSEPALPMQPQPQALANQPMAPILAVNQPSIDEGALIERLERLAALRASGAIDEAEFLKMKASALDRHLPSSQTER